MRMSVGAKIGAGFALALLMMVIIGVVSYQGASRMRADAEAVDHTREILARLEELDLTLPVIESGSRGFAIAGDDSYLDSYHLAIAQMEQVLPDLRRLFSETPNQLRRLTELEPFMRGKTAFMKEVVDVRREKGFTPAVQLVATGKGKDLMDEARKRIIEMKEEENAVLSRRSLESKASADRTKTLILSSVLLTFVVLGVIAFLVTRNIAVPLREITAAAERMSVGDLDINLQRRDRQDEVGVLTQAFTRLIEYQRDMTAVAEQVAKGSLTISVTPRSGKDVLGAALASMVETLRQQMFELREGVNIIATAASEILATTTELAAGAEQTAAAVAETTTTVEEIKQTSQLSSQKARNVSDNAQRAVSVSALGKKSVEDSILAMRRIQQQMEVIAESVVNLSEQSQTIGEIVATVNDLADQSNLLAVNAAIEAAKAGDQGKGFAVVAREVKNLAVQSKQATAQVRTILGDIQKAISGAVMATEQAGKAVESGVRQSGESGESIQKLGGTIDESAQAALQIAASSQQQLAGIDQVATAMSGINQATLQSVDGAKQSETAAKNLHELGQKLRQLVARYKLPQEEQAPPFGKGVTP
jgi:methyl-accepting chemotaxis protein